jgi:hypothetical protein
VRTRLDGKPGLMHPVSGGHVQGGDGKWKLFAMPSELKHLSERAVGMCVLSRLHEGGRRGRGMRKLRRGHVQGRSRGRELHAL